MKKMEKQRKHRLLYVLLVACLAMFLLPIIINTIRGLI